MPPKGWRKNADGQYPVQPREEPTNIDEILFPKSTVQKLAKSRLPDDMILGKDSLVAIQRSATVFVSHLLFQAQEIQRESGKKNLTDADVLQAVQRADLPGFAPVIQRQVQFWEQQKQEKQFQNALSEVSVEKKQKVKEEVPPTKKHKGEKMAVAGDASDDEDVDEVQQVGVIDIDDGDEDEDIEEGEGEGEEEVEVEEEEDDEVEDDDDDEGEEDDDEEDEGEEDEDEEDDEDEETNVPKPSDIEVVEGSEVEDEEEEYEGEESE